MLHNSEIIRRAYKYLFPGELELLKRTIRSVDRSPCVVINIGAGAGTSGLAILESRPDVVLHTIDIQDADSPFGCLYAERHVCQEAGYRLGENWYQHHMDSKELAKVWPGPVDVVFVDGGHEYEECAGDIFGWMPHILPGGYIAVHDYRKDDIPTGADGYHADGPHPIAFEGVDRTVDELLLPVYGTMERVASLIVFKVE